MKKFIPLLLVPCLVIFCIGFISSVSSISSVSFTYLDKKTISHSCTFISEDNGEASGVLSTLSPHAPITIDSDDDFGTYGFPGSGTVDNPYRIENYNITTSESHGISISETTKIFIIANCYAKGSVAGIYILNYSGSSTICNNTCIADDLYGSIYLHYSSLCIIANNTCIRNEGDGILLHYSTSCTVQNNVCTGNRYGIHLEKTGSCVIAHNTCNDNKKYGVILSYSDENRIYNNSLHDNDYYGMVLVSGSGNNVIYHNDFIANNRLDSSADSQASDDSDTSYWYNSSFLEGNYWSDLGNRETYPIDGPWGQSDLFPLNTYDSDHDSIIIHGDDSFAAKGFPGHGSEYHPYIIENYDIVTSDEYGIFISGVSVCFIIRNCYLNARRSGIFIQYAENDCEITNNVCNYNDDCGIQVDECSSCLISDNICDYNALGVYVNKSSCIISDNNCNFNSYNGIKIEDAPCSVLNNTCRGNENNGIEAYYSFNHPCNVLDNICNNNGYTGILFDNFDSSLISDNICTDNLGQGIYLVASDFNAISNNTCTSNGEDGIALGNCDNCEITGNYLQENEKWGINLNSVSENARIYFNNFVDNTYTPQAYDAGDNNVWYNKDLKAGNHWSDLNNNCKYKISGPAKSTDLYPLNRTDSCPTPIVVRLLSITIPVAISLILLSFLTPKYIVPFARHKAIPFIRKKRLQYQERRAKLLETSVMSCPKCGKESTDMAFCPDCGFTLPEPVRKKLSLYKRWIHLSLPLRIVTAIGLFVILGLLVIGIIALSIFLYFVANGF